MACTCRTTACIPGLHLQDDSILSWLTLWNFVGCHSAGLPMCSHSSIHGGMSHRGPALTWTDLVDHRWGGGVMKRSQSSVTQPTCRCMGYLSYSAEAAMSCVPCRCTACSTVVTSAQPCVLIIIAQVGEWWCHLTLVRQVAACGSWDKHSLANTGDPPCHQ